MDNYTFNLDQKEIEQELSCVICLSLPTEAPLQCQGCDSIMCHECFKRLKDTRACPLRCQNPKYAKIKPKTMMLFDCLQVRCEKCFESVKSLQIAKHKEICGKDSNYFSGNINPELSTKPFDDYYVSSPHKKSLQKTPAKPMKKKWNEAPEPMFYAPLFQDHQSPQVNQIPEPVRHTRIPRDCDWYFFVGLIGFVTFIILSLVGYFGIKLIFLDSNMQFQWLCTGNSLFEGNPPICLFSIGQFSVGIIAIGQVGIGLITIAQGGIGLLFGLGQGIVGCGVTVGMMTIGGYVKAAMLGVGFYKVDKVFLGVHSLYSLITSKRFYGSIFMAEENESN